MKLNRIIVAGIAASTLALALVASAAGYTFSNYLSVGSTGADVSALQTWLVANGFSIPSIQDGSAQPGYFGSQTQSAVEAYQASVGVPNTGFVGPLTIAKLNAGTVASGSASSQVAMACPAGFVCTPVAPAAVTCPAGYTCSSATTGATITSGTSITTPGVAGTIALSLWSTPSGVETYKGQAYDVGTYKLQAAASDMAVSSLSLDFSDRLWLYATSITLKDETGAIVGQVNNLGASNFSELTVGSDYRISIPTSFVVPATQSKYITVNIAFNAVSDRQNTTLYITEAQVRSVDGTGITDTESIGDGTTGGANARSFIYNGSNIGQIYVATDPNQPPTQLVQISTAVQTQNVLLGIFDIKSANENSTLQSLNIAVNSTGNINNLFNNIQIKANGLTYSASSIDTSSGSNTTSSSSVSFTNLQIPLTADVYTPVSVYVTVAPDSTGSLNGVSASTTLYALGTGSSANPSVIDATYNNLTVNPGTIVNNNQTFTDTGVGIPNLSTAYGTKSCDTNLVNCTQTFTFTYALTAGNNAVYVSTNPFIAISTSTNPAGFSFVKQDFSDDNTNGDDSSGAYFYVGAGQTKTFTASYQATASSSNAGTLTVQSLNYGTTAGGPYTTPLSNSTVTNTLKAILFH